MLTALIAGFALGFLGSIPLAGPISILVFSRGLEARYKGGASLAVGAALPEAVYAFLAFYGFSELLAAHSWVEPAAKVVAAAILLVLGVGLVRYKPKGNKDAVYTGPDRKRNNFFLGFTITLLNPALIFTWSAAVTTLYSMGLVPFKSSLALSFSIGACLGITGWFLLMLYLISRYRAKFGESILVGILRVMGAVLMGLGVVFLYDFYWLVAYTG